MSLAEDDGLVWKKTDDLLTSDSGADIWDDSALIKAYDRAVAQLRSDDPPASFNENESANEKRKKKKKKNKTVSNTKDKTLWNVGSKCLALYSVDGMYYEATILSINNDLAYVKFDYYENEEKVEIESILPVEMKTQLLNAEEKDNSEPVTMAQSSKQSRKEKMKKCNWSVSDLCYAPNERNVYEQAVINSFVDSSKCIVTFINGKKKKAVAVNLLQSTPESSFSWSLPGPHITPDRSDSASRVNMPFSPPLLPSPFSTMMMMPNPPLPPFMTNFQDWCNILHGRLNPTPPPYIPPPPSMPSNIIHGDEEALANMLMSWYMSGYHTGYYQGIKDLQRGKICPTSMPAFGPDRSTTRQKKNDPPNFDSNASSG